MRQSITLSLIIGIGFCIGVTAQDTRITPGVRGKVTGINTPQDEQRSEKTGSTSKEESCNDESACEGSTCDGGECPIMVKAMESLPKLIFKVGDMETCCHMTATRMAREEHEEIVYVVDKKRFHDSRDAFENLVRKTEIYVKRFVKPKVCSESGSTTLAGQTSECKQAAARLNDSVVSATKDLKITYRVGEKIFEKYHDARRYAKKTHTKGAYVVAGEKYEDEYEARLALAHQRFKAAVQAVQQTKAQLASETAESTAADASADGAAG